MLDRFGFADVAAFHRTEHGVELVELHLAKLEITQEISGKRLQLLCGLHQPLQDGIGIDLEDPRRAPNAQAFGQARDEVQAASA